MNSGFLENTMATVTDALTKVRPLSFVRRLQFLLIFLTLVIVVFQLSRPYMGREKIDTSLEGEFYIGKEAPHTIVSTKDIYYEDQDKTEQAKLKSEQSVPYCFDRDYSILTNIIDPYISEDFESLKKVTNSESANPIAQIRSEIPRWKNRSVEELTLILNYPRKDKLKKSVEQLVNILFSKNCILKDPHPDPISLNKSGGRIRNQGKKEQYSYYTSENIFPRSDMYRNPEIANKLKAFARENIQGYSDELLNTVLKIGLYYLFSYPACSYNEEATLQARKEARSKVSTVISKISTGEILVNKGEVITPEVYLKLEILNRSITKVNISSIFSMIMIQIAFVLIIATFLIKYNHKRLNDVSSNLVVFSIIWIILLITFIISRYYFEIDKNLSAIYYFALFIPTGMACMLIAFVYDERLALAVGFYLSFFVFFVSQNSSTSLLLAISTSVAGAVYGTRIRRRIDFVKAAFLLSLTQIFISTSGYLFDSRDYWVSNPTGSFFIDFLDSNIFKLYLLCIANGSFSSIAVQSLLPLYEYIFNIPTRFKLAELADTGHPLLQELLTKAPSTYTHTFLVAAMSERAAQNLGLDWLLTRVGVYFHDIGKIPNAGFFIENQHLIPKPEHIDKNNPAMAAKVVIDHVLDGIEMAKRARLPREVINFIPEHHGTSTMAFFYHKALANLPLKQRRKIKKSDFQYPGPKPQSKETAIVMIADSLEAASRSLDEVSVESLDNLIQKIINSKLAENQLDESGLTIGDLQVIKQSFKEVLLSSLHQRPKYPKPEETKALEEKNAAARKKNG